MSVSFDVDVSRAVAHGPRMQRAVAAAVSDAVLQSSTPFVPYDTHALRNSGYAQSDREGGEVAWGSADVRYARVQYDGYPNKRMAGTTDRWFESAKRADGDRWAQVAEKAAKQAVRRGA